MGTFYVQKPKSQTELNTQATSIAFFLPAHSWARIPGYQIDKTPIQGKILFNFLKFFYRKQLLIRGIGTMSAETLRFSAISFKSPFTRDELESGLKDILHALTKVVRRGSFVCLTLGSVGKLLFQNSTIKMRYVFFTFLYSKKEASVFIKKNKIGSFQHS